MQQPRPTVGDTMTVVRHVSVPIGSVVEARAPADSNIATLVAPPLVTREGDSVRIAYAIAVWAPGRNDLVIPGPIVVSMGGHVDTLADAHVGLDVASVLPAGRAPATLAPRPAHAWVPRGDESLLPAAVLLPLAIAISALIQWRWRRDGPRLPVAPPAPGPAPLPAARLDRWVASGEARLALEHLEWIVRARPDFAEWRARADALRFASGDRPELASLVQEALARLREGESQ